MTRLRIASVSVDLDPLRCYYEIHGLGEPAAQLADVVLRRGLTRFLELFSRFGVTATFFVVGSDAQEGATGRDFLRTAAAAGHELGNHSLSHFYDLSRRPRAEIDREIGDCHRALRELHPRGLAPVGFRAPGYSLSPRLLEAVQAAGYRYDSSLWPCPPYYFAKLAVLAKMALLGQPSRSIVAPPQMLLTPPDPYRPQLHKPWRRGDAALVELPIAVTRPLRLPAIGTFLFLPQPVRRLLLAGMRARPFFNLELHGIDLVDAKSDEIPDALVRRQPDLQVPLAAKLTALTETLEFLRDHCPIAPLCEVAESVQATGARPG